MIEMKHETLFPEEDKFSLSQIVSCTNSLEQLVFFQGVNLILFSVLFLN